VVQGAPTELLIVAEVATRLRVSRATVYKLVVKGNLSFVRVSNAIRFLVQVLRGPQH
jgi:excisionase family DNA binding protein